MQNNDLINISQAVVKDSLVYSIEFHKDEHYVHVKRVNLDGTATYFQLPTEIGESIQGNEILRESVSNNFSVQTDDYLIGVDSSSNAVTVTLPAASAVANKKFIIKDEGGAAETYNIIVDSVSGNIDGSSSITISINYTSVTVYSDGTNYFLI